MTVTLSSYELLSLILIIVVLFYAIYAGMSIFKVRKFRKVETCGENHDRNSKKHRPWSAMQAPNIQDYSVFLLSLYNIMTLLYRKYTFLANIECGFTAYWDFGRGRVLLSSKIISREYAAGVLFLHHNYHRCLSVLLSTWHDSLFWTFPLMNDNIQFKIIPQ